MPRRRGNGQQRRDKRPESPPPHHTPRHEYISSSSSQGPVYSYVYFGVLIFVVLAWAISLFSLWIQHTAQTNALMNIPTTSLSLLLGTIILACRHFH